MVLPRLLLDGSQPADVGDDVGDGGFAGSVEFGWVCWHACPQRATVPLHAAVVRFPGKPSVPCVTCAQGNV